MADPQVAQAHFQCAHWYSFRILQMLEFGQQINGG